MVVYMFRCCSLKLSLPHLLNNAEGSIRAKNYRKAKWEEGAAPGDENSKDKASRGETPLPLTGCTWPICEVFWTSSLTSGYVGLEAITNPSQGGTRWECSEHCFLVKLNLMYHVSDLN